MKNNKLISIFLGCLLTCNPFKLTAAAAATASDLEQQAIDAKLYPNLARFVHKHQLPESFAEHLEKEQGLKFIPGLKTKPQKLTTLPLYFKRDDVERVINADRMKNCITAHKLDHLTVPRKYIEKRDGAWCVFSEEIKGTPLCKAVSGYDDEWNLLLIDEAKTKDLTSSLKSVLSVKVMRQLFILVKETHFWDWGVPGQCNWMFTLSGGKLSLTCIDTESQSFDPEIETEDLLNDTFEFFEDFLTESVKTELQDFINDTSDAPKALSNPYNDPVIDFDKVKEELAAYKKRETYQRERVSLSLGGAAAHVVYKS